MNLYIRHPDDDPHERNTVFPNETRCGLSMFTMKEITEKQVLVFLKDRRCNDCHPNWSQAQGHRHG